MWTYALLLGVVGCQFSSPSSPSETASDLESEGSGWEFPDTAANPPTAFLEIHALDVWGQPLPEGSSLTVLQDGEPLEWSGWPVVRIPLTEGAVFDVELDANGYAPQTATLTYDGSDSLDAIPAESSVPDGFATSHDLREVYGEELPVHAVFFGLGHRWFSSQGRPARRGNSLELFTSGEAAWESVAEDLDIADDRIHVSTWWWESDFELVRDAWTHPYSNESERLTNTILNRLDESPAEKRVLVWHMLDQDGIVDWVTTDEDLRDRGETSHDGFEFMGQANETSGAFWFEPQPFWFTDRLFSNYPEAFDRNFDPDASISPHVPSQYVDLTDFMITADINHASYHQKFLTIDGSVAYIGGMNLRKVDWDTDDHAVFEPRRMNFDASMSERLDVADKLEFPDNGPRKDYMVRIEGPTAQDAEDVFHTRWAHQLDKGVDYSENASDFEVYEDLPSAGNLQAQVTATLPEPFLEHAIAETWFNAVDNATDYIYIEDQYFRIPMLVDRILERMNEQPSLQLVVITKPVSEYTDLGCVWTYTTLQELSAAFPDRFHAFQLKSFDTHTTWGIDETDAEFVNMDVHAKMLIVDDVFLSVGSANKNNRGAIYEGELNLAVYDPHWVEEQRHRIIEQLLPPGETPYEDSAWWIYQLDWAAYENSWVEYEWALEGGDLDLDGDPLPAAYQALGFVYPLPFNDPSECLFEDVGPDVM